MRSTQILEASLNVLETYGWTQQYYARDKSGDIAGPLSGNATCFCSYGAIKKAIGADFEGLNGGEYTSEVQDALTSLEIAVIDYSGLRTSIIDYNDRRTTTKEDILGVFRRAIEISRAAE